MAHIIKQKKLTPDHLLSTHRRQGVGCGRAQLGREASIGGGGERTWGAESGGQAMGGRLGRLNERGSKPPGGGVWTGGLLGGGGGVEQIGVTKSDEWGVTEGV